MAEIEYGTRFSNWLNKKFHEASLWPNDLYLVPYLHPIARELVAEFPAIQAEVDEILKRYDEFALFHSISPQESYISNDDGWRMFFFRAVGWNFKRNQAMAPTISRLLRKHRRSVVSAYISCLGPNKMLKPHFGPWAGILRMHLGVRVPHGCRLAVKKPGGNWVAKPWKEGACILFDDTNEHFAFNNSDEVRAVLFLDIVRPMRFPWNFIAAALMAVGRLSPDILSRWRRHRAWERSFFKGD